MEGMEQKIPRFTRNDKRKVEKIKSSVISNECERSYLCKERFFTSFYPPHFPFFSSVFFAIMGSFTETNIFLFLYENLCTKSETILC